MSSGSYPVLDSLKNLRIRVRLERIGSVAGALPSFAAFINEATDSRLTASINAGQEVDEFVFRWQQKVFSPREYARYSVASNCVTPREQQYHRDMMELRNTQGERTINRLFTYVGEDPLPEEITNKLITANVEEEKGDSALAERLSNVRHRKVVPQSRLPSTALSNPVSDMPSAELMKKSRSAAVSSHVMYLMAYLGAKDVQDFQTIDQSDEKLLCKIRVIDDRIVEFKPDFNEPSQPHRIEGRMGVFNYFLSNASPKVSNEALENEEKREAKLSEYRASLMASKVGTLFDVPEDGVLKTLVLAEIRSAWNFEYDGLFVQYMIDLPKGWYTSTPEALQGVTQLCYTTEINQQNVAHFAFPIELDLCYKWRMYDQDPGPMPRWPHLLLCVSSFDQWSRHRTEGYGCVALPTLPGQSTVTVHTWRPQHNRTSDLRRFFIGGSPELESIDLACVPNGHTGSRLSKVGLRTVSSGVVELKFRVVHQCRSYIAPERQRQIKYGALLERIGILIIQRGAPKSILLTSLHSTDTDHLLNQCSCFAFESHLVIADMIVFSASTTSGMHWSIIAVLDAFEKARRRMLHVRDNVFYTNKSFDQSSE